MTEEAILIGGEKHLTYVLLNSGLKDDLILWVFEQQPINILHPQPYPSEC